MIKDEKLKSKALFGIKNSGGYLIMYGGDWSPGPIFKKEQ